MTERSKHVTDLIHAPAEWVDLSSPQFRAELPGDGSQVSSTSFGAGVKGERLQVGLVHKARGTGSRLHRHGAEQFNFVLRGTLMGEIDGEPFRCPRGHVVHVPANAAHSIMGDPDDADAIFYVVKDTAVETLGDGELLDRESPGPRLAEGFRFDEKADRSRDFTV